jgi:hypothetical protein
MWSEAQSLGCKRRWALEREGITAFSASGSPNHTSELVSSVPREKIDPKGRISFNSTNISYTFLFVLAGNRVELTQAQTTFEPIHQLLCELMCGPAVGAWL